VEADLCSWTHEHGDHKGLTGSPVAAGHHPPIAAGTFESPLRRGGRDCLRARTIARKCAARNTFMLHVRRTPAYATFRRLRSGGLRRATAGDRRRSSALPSVGDGPTVGGERAAGSCENCSADRRADALNGRPPSTSLSRRMPSSTLAVHASPELTRASSRREAPRRSPESRTPPGVAGGTFKDDGANHVVCRRARGFERREAVEATLASGKKPS